MPNNRFYKLDVERQDLILFTSLKEFMNKNFETASINQISKSAGLSAGSLYYYFEDKEDLFYSTIDYATKGIKFTKEEILSLFDHYGYWEGITEIIKRRLDFTRVNPEKMHFIQRLLLSKDGIEASGSEDILETFRLLFNYGYDKGYINNLLPRSLMFDVHLGLITSINKWELESSEAEKQLVDNNNLINDYVNMIKSAIGVK